MSNAYEGSSSEPQPWEVPVSSDVFMTQDVDAPPRQNLAGDPFMAGGVPEERTRPSSSVEQDVFLGQVSRTGPSPAQATSQDPFMTEIVPPDARSPLEGIQQDPFMTRTVPPYAVSELESLQRDPFLNGDTPEGAVRPLEGLGQDPMLNKERLITHAPVGTPASVTEDVFLTHAEGVEPDQKHIESVVEDPFLAHGEPRVWVPDPSFWDLMGPGDVHREKWVLRVLVFVSWLVFILVLSSWLMMRHVNQAMNMAFTVFVFLISTIISMSYFRTSRKTQFPLVSLGLLFLIAAVLGLACGLYGWDLSWRQLWWLKTGRHVEGAEAETPAWIAADAATMEFNEVLAGRPVPTVKTSVAYSYTGGFRRDGHMYCVAPLLNEEVLKSNPPLIRVNYWAVGTDCCRSYDGFHCGDSRSWKSSSAVVMVDDFIPCVGCSKDGMSEAVAKAETVHGLVSAPGAKFVRWVEDTNSVKRDTSWTCAIFFIVACLGALIIIIPLALLFWYYGVGKKPRDSQPTASTKLLGAVGNTNYV